MDFENDNIDPYEVLGVPFGASIEVCKATYKSLTKIYPPDRFVIWGRYKVIIPVLKQFSLQILDIGIEQR